MSNREKIIRAFQGLALLVVFAGFGWAVAVSSEWEFQKTTKNPMSDADPDQAQIDLLGVPEGFTATRSAGGAIIYKRVREALGDSSARPAFGPALQTDSLPSAVHQ